MARMPAADECGAPGLSGALAEITATRGWVSNALRAFGHAPEGLRRFAAMGEYVRFQTSLPDRMRELAIISTGRKCSYAWTHHVPFARKAGVSDAEIASLEGGSVPDSLDSSERAALQYVHAFQTGRDYTDAEFGDILQALGPQRITDLTLLIGYFSTLGWALNTFRVDLEPGATLDDYWSGGCRAALGH